VACSGALQTSPRSPLRTLTYVALPFVLSELDVERQDNRLAIRFPPALRTHSARQIIRIDDHGLI
jgi:hypothetical protein